MQWTKKYIYIPQYKLTSCNQYGDRFKCESTKQLTVARLSCEHGIKTGEHCKDCKIGKSANELLL